MVWRVTRAIAASAHGAWYGHSVLCLTVSRQLSPRQAVSPMPHKHTLEPCPKLPDGPVHPLPQGLFALLKLLAEPLGDRLAPHRTLARPRRATDGREAEKVKGFRFPLATSLAPFTCPTPELNAARRVRVQFELKPVEAFPQVAQKLLGVVFVLEADDEI